MAVKSIKLMLKRALPRAAVGRYQRWRRRVAQAANAHLAIRDVFRDIYARNEWGGARGAFYSGTGSEESQATAYAEAVRKFVLDRGIKSIVDLGCGDYRVGRMLRSTGVHYSGVDIVPELIERNRALFADQDTAFLCRDLLDEELPDGELCLVRQVLQHLSNAEIAKAVGRLSRYHYVLITEHYPAPGRLVSPNFDKPHGPDTRVVDGSGVFLDLPPFCCTLGGVVLEAAVERPIVHPGETLRTFVLGRSERRS